MTFTPYITIYPESNFNYAFFGDSITRATLIFSKNLDYNKAFYRKRINIHLGDEERFHTHGSIKSIWIKNTIDTSHVFNDVEKINTFLKIIYHSVMTIAEIEGWETAAFENAYHRSISDNGIFIWHSISKANKNRKLKARIRLSLDKDGKVPVIAEFFNDKLIPQFEIPIIDTFLYFVNWERLFEKPTWLDHEKFGFDFLNSQLQIFANSNSRISEAVISEKNWSREKIEGELRRLTFRYFASEKERIEWANK